MLFAKFLPGRSLFYTDSYSVVQEFLRGPQEMMDYTGVTDKKHASYFVEKYFNGRYANGYSVEVDIDELGSKACFIIKKTCTAFEHDLEYWKKEQQTELSSLEEQLWKFLGPITGRNKSRSGGGSEEAIFLDSPDASSEREKRRKVSNTTEYNDLSLDNNE